MFSTKTKVQFKHLIVFNRQASIFLFFLSSLVTLPSTYSTEKTENIARSNQLN